MTDGEWLNRRNVLKATGAVAFGGAIIPGAASAHPPEEIRFCGSSQVCVDSERSYRIVYATEEDDGYSCRISPGTDEVEHNEPGCFTADDDEKIIGVLGGIRHMYHNPNKYSENALDAVTLADCTGCIDDNCDETITYTQIGEYTYEVDSQEVIVRTHQCKPPEEWTSHELSLPAPFDRYITTDFML